jgi:hypothetical protein
MADDDDDAGARGGSKEVIPSGPVMVRLIPRGTEIYSNFS